MAVSRSARNFSTVPATADRITFSNGSSLITTPITMIALARKNVDGGFSGILQTTTSSGHWEFYYEDAAAGSVDRLANFAAGVQRSSLIGGPGSIGTSFTVASADGWCIVASSTPSSASPNSTFFKYPLATATWTIATDGTYPTDWASQAGGTLIAGGSKDVTTGNHDIIAAALFNTALSSATIQTMITKSSWINQNPVGMWMFDQASTGTSVSDITGNGANQSAITGTTVTSYSDANVDAWYGTVPRMGFINHSNPGIA